MQTNTENTLLSQYYTEEQVADFLGKTINSLRADASRRKGAPRTVIGKRILYNKNSFEAWILEREVLKNKNKNFLDKQKINDNENLTVFNNMFFETI